MQAIAHYAKETDIESTYNKLVFAHEKIVAKLCIFVESPTCVTTMAQFIQTLELKKKS